MTAGSPNWLRGVGGSRLITLLLAVSITLTAMGMAAAASWDRGGTLLDRVLLVALSVAICAGTHFIPALSKRKLAWLLWAGCLLGTVYSQLSFLTYASMRAGDDRAEHSVRSQGVERQIEAVQAALAGITSRPVAVIGAEIAVTEGWRARHALKLELAEATRAAALRDELVRLSSTSAGARVTGAHDPVIARIAAITGSNEASIALLIGLGLAILVELTGVLLWCEVLRVPMDAPVMTTVQPAVENDPMAELKAAIQAGRCEFTVKGIRQFLGCGQAKAMEVRRLLTA